MRKLILVFLVLGIVSLPVMGAPPVIYGGSTGTSTMEPFEVSAGQQTYVVSWTSTSGGAAAGTFINLYGTIERVAFAPVAAASPTANYDVVLNDELSVDLLQGEGANQSATVAADAVPLIAEIVSSATTHHKVVVGGSCTLSVTNAGSAKQGKFLITISK